MTMPNERFEAVERTRNFLRDILWDETLPEKVREQAHRCIKHFPWDTHMEDVAEACPDIFEYRGTPCSQKD